MPSACINAPPHRETLPDTVGAEHNAPVIPHSRRTPRSTAMADRRRKFWGWGYEDQGPNATQKQHMAERIAPRITPPSALAALCSSSTYDRAGHSYGKSFRDVVRAFQRDYPNPFDLVAFPRDEQELVRVLEWCDADNIAVCPYGGGSSVTGGVEPPSNGDYRGAVSIDLGRLDKVIEID